MKIVKTQAERIRIPNRPAPFEFARFLLDPSVATSFSCRTLTLEPREYEGHTVMAAYDRESDTLFVKDGEGQERIG